MRKKIINFLINNKLYFFLKMFHKIVGKNKIINFQGNNLNYSNAHLYRDCFVVKNGTNNKVYIGENTDLHNSSIIFKGSNNSISFGKNGFINGIQLIVEGDYNTFIIDDDAFILDDTRIWVVDGSNIKIGKGCMFSDRIDIRTTDNHSIIDCLSGKRINFEKDINLGNRVWIGHNVTILKGVNIADDCIVGAASVITKNFNESNSVIVGNPGRVVKKNVYWMMERIKNNE